MSASPRVELVFRYVRDADGLYAGSARVEDASGAHPARPFHAGTREAWVTFVYSTLRELAPTQVSLELTRKDGTTYRHVVDARTVERIKSGDLGLEDLVL